MRRKSWANRSYAGDGVAAAAILLGGALAMAFTTFLAVAFYCGGDAVHVPDVPVGPIEQPTEVIEEDFIDPRGAERGPNALEWEVIRVYTPIESMTADAPSLSVVDESLSRLRGYAEANPRNPYIQELYLKGLRVAAYWAEDAGLSERANALRETFDAYSVDFLDYDGVVLEAMRFSVQRLERGCLDRDFELTELDALTWRVEPTPEILEARSYGRRVAADADCAVSG